MTGPVTSIFEGLAVKKATYERQYSGMYWSRLQTLRPLLMAQMTADSIVVREQLKDVELSQECWVTGTLFREMKDRPAALDAYNDVQKTVRERYARDEDEFLLEDETGRAKLLPSELLQVLVTGLVVGLRVEEQENGALRVLQVLLPGLGSPAPPLAVVSSAEPQAEGALLAFVSGRIGGARGALLAAWLTGAAGAPRSRGLAARVGRLVVLGNAVGSALPAEGSIKHHHQTLTQQQEDGLLIPVRAADALLSRLCAALPVHLLPGPLDPAAASLPQQPLSPVLFPLASRWESLSLETNPWRASLGPLALLCSSGQPLDNLYTYGPLSRLDSAAEALRWRHLCPTAPDTLACYPSPDDPFTLVQPPHILAHGNQPSFGSRLVGGTRVLLVPAFQSSGCLVLLDPASLQVSTIQFSL